MRDLQNLVELGREFAKPWKRATQFLSVLLVVTFVGLCIMICKEKHINFSADFNSESEITQTQG